MRARVSTVLAFALLAGLAECGGSNSESTGPGSETAAPVVSLSPPAVTFAGASVGATSAAQSVSLSNTGTAALTITAILSTGDFAESNNCPATLAAGMSCTIQVTFTPTAAGARSGTLTVTDNAAGSPQMASLAGTGIVGATSGIAKTFFAITVPPPNSPTTWLPVVPFGTAGKVSGNGYWATIEPTKGAFNWAPVDNIIGAAASAGITNVLYTFFQTPQWASSNPAQSCSATQTLGILGCAAPPADINDWTDFVTAIVTRYKGRIHYYEIWNEPDVASEYSGTIPQMVTLAQSAYQIIKTIDPAAIVIAPSPSLGGVLSSDPNCGATICWLAGYLAAGGARYADAIGFHGKACGDSTSLCVAHDIACPKAAIQACGDAPLINQIHDARAIMATNGLSALPLINTEGGYSTELATNELPSASGDQQSAYVSRFYITQAAEGVSIAVYFSWLESKAMSFMGFGTTSAYAENNTAYQQTYNWLDGATMHGACAADQSAIWTCSLTLANGRAALVVWSDAVSSYTPAPQFTSYADLAGATFTIHGAVSIGMLPILLQ